MTNLGVRDLALSKGATPISIRGSDCAGIVPTKDTWYTEQLAVESAPESFPDEVIDYSVRNLLKRIFNACMLELQLPDKSLTPDELQAFIETLCRKYAIT